MCAFELPADNKPIVSSVFSKTQKAIPPPDVNIWFVRVTWQFSTLPQSILYLKKKYNSLSGSWSYMLISLHRKGQTFFECRQNIISHNSLSDLISHSDFYYRTFLFFFTIPCLCALIKLSDVIFVSSCVLVLWCNCCLIIKLIVQCPEDFQMLRPYAAS